MITVARYFEPSEAHVVRALLESAGLAATVADDHHVTANYPLSTALGGVRVQVPHESFEAARELVAAYASGELQRELEEQLGEEPEACPECGAHGVTGQVPVSSKLLAIRSMRQAARWRFVSCRVTDAPTAENPMQPSIAPIALVVRDYDEALAPGLPRRRSWLVYSRHGQAAFPQANPVRRRNWRGAGIRPRHAFDPALSHRSPGRS